MTPVVAVLHAEDIALEFLSVLARHAGDDVHVLAGARAEPVVLPGGRPLAERLDLLAPHVDPGGNTAPLPATETLAARLRDVPEPEVWTHSPADHRSRRARFGRSVVHAAGVAACAVGDNPHLQLIADLAVSLDGAQAAAKLGFAAIHAAPLLNSRVADRLVTTDRVPAVERFVRLEPGPADRLYALTASLTDDAAQVADPWEFESSAYEGARLDATAAWVARWWVPDDGPVVEVGACEGALARRLVDKGYTVYAAEPNPAFHARLRTVPGVEATADGLEELAAGGPAGAYLLSEMLYYGQDLDLLHRLPANLLLISLAAERLNDTVWPWVREQSAWTVAERCELAAPALEFVCDGRAYLRKRGSRGLALTRTGGRA
ncbi:hypothetical protein [Nonomuraea sp. SBT364]|uniref:hypothetical protein n=1 Tax=Nonomuraea sp. SBT364 TaxID=1580530 RepID=UPI00066C2707|nr:hypothetical protein [Nonomuraea sp. SBT364]